MVAAFRRMLERDIKWKDFPPSQVAWLLGVSRASYRELDSAVSRPSSKAHLPL